MTPKAKFRIDCFVYRGISDDLDKAIEDKDKSNIELLEEMVNYYNEEIITSGKFLSEKLEKLKCL